MSTKARSTKRRWDLEFKLDADNDWDARDRLLDAFAPVAVGGASVHTGGGSTLVIVQIRATTLDSAFKRGFQVLAKVRCDGDVVSAEGKLCEWAVAP